MRRRYILLCICSCVAVALCWAGSVTVGDPGNPTALQPGDQGDDQKVTPYDTRASLPEPPPGPRAGGDTCGTATGIALLPYTDDGTTAGFIDDYDEACPYTGSTSPDVVYVYTPSVDECVEISLCDPAGTTNYDTKLYVYEDTCASPYHACNDDNCSTPVNYVSELSDNYDGCVCMRAGHDYYIIVDGYGGGSGDYTIDVDNCADMSCCADPTGACCVDGSCDATNTELECDALGGYWGEGQACPAFICPPLCPENTLFGQLAHGPDEGWSFANADEAGPYLVQENFSGVIGDICDLHWWGINAWNDGVDWFACVKSPDQYYVKFYTDAGGAPGTEVCSYTLTPTKTDTGILYASTYPMYEYDTTLSSCCALTDGWVSIQGVDAGQDCWFLWASSSEGDNESLQNGTGTGFDRGMCLTGASGEQYGACCDDSTSICLDDPPVPQSACEAPKRFVADALCADLDPPCGEGACCDPSTGGCTVETEADCDALHGPGQWIEGQGCDPNPCPQPAPENDECADAEVLCCGKTLTGTTTGATASDPAVPPCVVTPTNDVWYTFVGNGRWVTIETCGSAIDTLLAIYCGDTCNDLVCVDGNDDSCGTQSSVTLCTVPFKRYFVNVSGYNGAEGAIQVSMICGAPCNCVICPHDSTTPEDEPCGDDSNGGCNSTPEAFDTLICDETVCGTAWADGGSRDTDWYEFTLDDWYDVTWSASVEFPAILYLLTRDCASTTLLAEGDAGPCETGATATVTLGPGTYVAFISTGDLSAAMYDGWPCVDEECRQFANEYMATLTCAPIAGGGVCCESDGTCHDVLGGAEDCDTWPGSTFIPGVNCTESPCPTPGDDCTSPFTASIGLSDLPYTNTNTNCGRGDVYDDPSTTHCLYYYDSGEDMIYEFTVTEAMDVDVTLDPKGTTYSGVALGIACPPTDDCITAAYDSSGDPKTTDCVHLEPGTYYIQVDTWSTPDCIPDFDLTIDACVVPVGRCCLDPWPTCEDLTAAECANSNGVWDETLDCTTPCPAPLANDDCADATVVTDGTPAAEGDNCDAGDDDAEASCQSNSNKDVWFEYTATCTGIVTVDTENSGQSDTVLSVYDSCGGTELQCDDDGGTSFLSSASFNATQSVTYYIRLASYSSGCGDYDLNIGCVVPVSEPPGPSMDAIEIIRPIGTPPVEVPTPEGRR